MTTKTDNPSSNDDANLIAIALEQARKEELNRKWASWVESEYQKCKNARAPFERQWYLNLAFTAGKQYVAPIDMPGVGFRLTSPKAPPWRVRLVVNKVRTAVRTECSKLTSSRPIPTVVPATNEGEDFSAAQVGEQLLKAAFNRTEFNHMIRDWVWWGVVTGNSFIKTFWDGSAKDYDAMQVPELPPLPNGEPMPEEILELLPPEVKDQLTKPVPAVGKIQAERITPFHLFVPDLLASSIEKQPYVIQVMTRNPLWVEKAFGFKPTCDTKAASTIMEAATIIAKGSEQHLDSVLVKEMWLKPGTHEDFPDGGVLTVINNKIVQAVQKWPLPFPEFPYYKYDGIPTGGFYTDSIVVDLIPIQKEYNKTKSQMIEIKNTMGKPKLVYQKGSINPRQISSEPGQSIPYTPGYEKPQIMPGVEVPASMGIELDRLTSDFDDISGQHEITRGAAPSQISSGTAIAFLQEQDDSKLSYQVSSIEGAMELLGRHYLNFVSTYWDDKRVVKIGGRDSSYEAIHWKKGALRGNTDVRIQSGSALPYSKAAKQAMITEYMQLGFIPPEVGLEILNMGGFDKALDDVLTDKRQAQRENLKMADTSVTAIYEKLMSPAPGPNGEPPIETVDPNTDQPVQFNGDGSLFQPQPPISVNSWDNHEAHIQYHNNFRKTQEFELLPEANKKAFELHVQLHQMSLMANLVNTHGQTIQENVAPPLMPPGEAPGEPAVATGRGESGGSEGNTKDGSGPPQ